MTITEVPISLSRLPQPFSGFRIAHLTDLHVRRFGRREAEIAETVSRAQPHLIVCTGDYIRHPDAMPECGKLLQRLKAPHGVFASLGNWEHECFLPVLQTKRDFESWGVRLLVNESQTIEVGGASIAIVGLDDPTDGHPNMQRALRGLSPDTVKIMLCHSPSIANSAWEHRIDLILSGHTHGGQIRLPGIYPFWLPRGSAQFINGRYDVNGTILYVSRGLGRTGLPRIRFRCPAELPVIELRTPEPSRKPGFSERPDLSTPSSSSSS